MLSPKNAVTATSDSRWGKRSVRTCRDGWVPRGNNHAGLQRSMRHPCRMGMQRHGMGWVSYGKERLRLAEQRR